MKLNIMVDSKALLVIDSSSKKTSPLQDDRAQILENLRESKPVVIIHFHLCPCFELCPIY